MSLRGDATLCQASIGILTAQRRLAGVLPVRHVAAIFMGIAVGYL